MAVVSFTRLLEGRTVQMASSGAWEHKDTWQLVYDAPEPDPLAMLGDPLLPSFGEAHPENSGLLLKGVSGRPAVGKDSRTWNYELTWSTLALTPDRHDPQRYDDSTRATKSWTHQAEVVVVEEAYVSDDFGSTFSGDKEPVASTVGDLFVPGITKNRYLPVCSYSRNQLTVPAATLKLPGYVNNDSFTLDGIAISAGQALILSTSVSAVKKDILYSFRTVDFQICIREEGWDDRLLNRGFNVIVDLAGTTQPAYVRNGLTDTSDLRKNVPSRDPVTLNIYGQNRELWEDQGSYGGTFVPHYRHFRHLNFTAFSSLGFA